MSSARPSKGRGRSVESNLRAGGSADRAAPPFAQFDCSTLGSSLKLLFVDFRSSTFEA